MKKPSIIIGTLSLLGAFGLSLFFEGYQDIIYAPATLLLLVPACLIILPSFWTGAQIPASATALLMFLFWLYVTFSLSWSSVPFSSLITYLVFISLPLVFFTLLMGRNRETWLKTGTTALMLALGILSGWAILQSTVFLQEFGSRAHHPLPNPNNLAGLLNLGLLPAMAWFLFPGKKKSLHYAALALTLILFTGLLATQSRGGLISFLIAAPLLFMSLQTTIKQNWKSFVLLLVLTGSLFSFMQTTTTAPLSDRMAELSTPLEDTTITSRIALWKATGAMVQDHPWLGTGFGTFYLYYPAYRPPLIDNSAGYWVHMDPLQFWAEMGIAAPLLFYALLIAVLLRTFRSLRATEPDSPLRPAIMGLFCGLLALLLHTHVTFHLYVMPILIVCGVWLAAWYALTAKALKDQTTSFLTASLENWQKPFMAVVTVSIIGLIALMTISSSVGRYYLMEAKNNIGQAGIESFMTNIQKADKWAPGSFIDPEVHLAGLYIDILTAPGGLLNQEEQDDLFQQTLALLDGAESMNPAWAEIDHKRAKLYAVTGDKAQAATYWQRAIAKNSRHFRAREELANIYVSNGNPAMAYDILEEGLQYPHPANVQQTYTAILKNIEDIAMIQKLHLLKKNRKNSGKTP